MRRCVLLALVLSISGRPAGAAIQVSEDIKKAVVFLYGEEPDGQYQSCTGFLVGVPASQDPTRMFTYLATARHCLQVGKKGAFYPRIYVRLNNRAGGADLIKARVSTEGLGRNVHLHTDPDVDLALIEFHVNPAAQDIRVLAPDLLTDRDSLEKAHISEGTDVFFTGLFTSYQGAQRNYPIVRFGKLALVTPEAIEWGEDKVRSHLYLMEVTAFGGNSGAPVFFYLSTDRIPDAVVIGPPQVLLAGVMTMAFENERPVKVSDGPPTPKSVQNLGVAGVTPAYYLRDILFSDALRRDRGETHSGG